MSGSGTVAEVGRLVRDVAARTGQVYASLCTHLLLLFYTPWITYTWFYPIAYSKSSNKFFYFIDFMMLCEKNKVKWDDKQVSY